MGADLIIAGVELPLDYKCIDWPKVRLFCQEAEIKTLEDSDSSGSFEVNELDEDDIRSQLTDDFGTLRECIDNNLRDASVYTFGGTYVALTGGMSWGDDPSESFDSFSRIATLVDNGFTFPIRKEN